MKISLDEVKSAYKHSLIRFLYDIKDVTISSIDVYAHNPGFYNFESRLKDGVFKDVYFECVWDIFLTFMCSNPRISRNLLYCLEYYLKWNSVDLTEVQKNMFHFMIESAFRSTNKTDKIAGLCIIKYFPDRRFLRLLSSMFCIEKDEDTRTSMRKAVKIMLAKMDKKELTIC